VGQAADRAACLTFSLCPVTLDLAEVGRTQKDRGEHALGCYPSDPSAFGDAVFGLIHEYRLVT
jgi:hypothetical protein